MHTSKFRLKFGHLCLKVTFEIGSWSPSPNKLFITFKCYIQSNLVKKVNLFSRYCTIMLTPDYNVITVIQTENNILLLMIGILLDKGT